MVEAGRATGSLAAPFCLNFSLMKGTRHTVLVLTLYLRLISIYTEVARKPKQDERKRLDKKWHLKVAHGDQLYVTICMYVWKDLTKHKGEH